jgi:hypothetical protein
MGAFLVFLYNVTWGSNVWARGSEVSDFCLFLAVFPARYFYSISASFFLYGAHAIYFFPLVTVLEPLQYHLFIFKIRIDKLLFQNITASLP